jgi:hypothetical protein
MTDEFEMSMMGELKFFLGFEVKQYREGTFINQAKYTHTTRNVLTGDLFIMTLEKSVIK